MGVRNRTVCLAIKASDLPGRRLLSHGPQLAAATSHLPHLVLLGHEGSEIGQVTSCRT